MDRVASIRKANVLLVDDRYENLLSLKAVLEAPDLEIHLARSGNEALSKALEQSFACVLLDVEMPDLSGFEVARILQNDPVLKSTPIIFLTAFRKNDVDINRGYEFGAVDYLFKPIDPEVVRSKVRVFAELYRKQQTIAELNQALHATNEDLRQFTKVAAHDLKEPARVIRTLCQFASRQIKNDNFAEAQQNLDLATDASFRICSLLDDLVALLALRDNSQERQLIDLAKLVAEVISENRATIDSSHAQITALDLPLVHGNRTELKVVINNLLTNAIKFRSEVPLAITFSAYRVNEELVVAIKDTGQGIERRHQDKIFELFHRTHSEKDRLGNGVGLAVCRQIVEKHGGRIWVDSDPGAGSTFYFSVPHHKATPTLSTPAE